MIAKRPYDTIFVRCMNGIIIYWADSCAYLIANAIFQFRGRCIIFRDGSCGNLRLVITCKLVQDIVIVDVSFIIDFNGSRLDFCLVLCMEVYGYLTGICSVSVYLVFCGYLYIFGIGMFCCWYLQHLISVIEILIVYPAFNGCIRTFRIRNAIQIDGSVAVCMITSTSLLYGNSSVTNRIMICRNVYWAVTLKISIIFGYIPVYLIVRKIIRLKCCG